MAMAIFVICSSISRVCFFSVSASVACALANGVLLAKRCLTIDLRRSAHLLRRRHGLGVLPHAEQHQTLPDIGLHCGRASESDLQSQGKAMQRGNERMGWRPYALMQRDAPYVGSTLIASSVSFTASGKAASFVYAAARLVYARGSDGRRLMASVYALTESTKLPAYMTAQRSATRPTEWDRQTLKNALPSSRALSDSSGLMYAFLSVSAFSFSTCGAVSMRHPRTHEGKTHVTQLVQDIRRAVLGQRLLIELDSAGEVTLPLVRCADAAQGFGNQLVVGADLGGM